MPVPYPYYVAKGTFTSGAGAITVPAPTCQAGDLLILVVATANNTILLGTNANRWNAAAVAQTGVGTANSTLATRVGVYFQFAPNSSPGSQAITDSGDYQTGIMISVRGVSNTAAIPFLNAQNIISRGTSSTNVNCPSVITTRNYCKVLCFIGLDKDANDSDTITSWFPPATSTNGTEIHDQTVNTGNGGGLAIYTFDQLNAGNTGELFGLGDSSTPRSYITIALNTSYQRRISKVR